MMAHRCPDGGIGRRTRFRCERSNILGSSNLLLGTMFFLSASQASGEQISMDLSSDNVVMDTKNHECLLEGNAEVTCSIGIDKYDFKANKIIVFYNKKEFTKPKNIKAYGKVVFSYGDIKISSKTCIYDMEKVFFENNVVIINKKLGTINADKVVYNMKTKKIDILSDHKVKVIINKNI